MLSTLQLSTVEATTEIVMPLTFLNSGTHLIDWHLAIVHLSIPNTESRTGRRPYDPFRVIIGYHLARQLAVRALVKIPWTAVRLVRSKIESPKTFTVELYPSSIGFGHNRAFAIHFHESRGTSIAHNLVDE